MYRYCCRLLSSYYLCTITIRYKNGNFFFHPYCPIQLYPPNYSNMELQSKMIIGPSCHFFKYNIIKTLFIVHCVYSTYRTIIMVL